jgi:hypothetical protein
MIITDSLLSFHIVNSPLCSAEMKTFQIYQTVCNLKENDFVPRETKLNVFNFRENHGEYASCNFILNFNYNGYV